MNPRVVFIRVTPALHKAIRIKAATEDRTIQQVATSALRAYLGMPAGSAPRRKRRRNTTEKV